MSAASLGPLLIAGTAVLAGAAVQSGVGFGLGLVAAPVVTLLDPSLMPGSLLVVAAVLPLLTYARERGHADWSGLRWAFAGRVVGTAVGVWAVAVLPGHALGVIVATVVLAAVALTTRTIRLPVGPGTLVTAGVLAGVTATTTSIGGPPLALIYQRAGGPRIRATLAVFFGAGALLSLGSLAATGHLHARQVGAGLVLVPFMLAGFALSRPLHRHLDPARMRIAVLGVAALSAGALLVWSLV